MKGGGTFWNVVQIVEYQDAYGFFHRAQALYQSIASQVRTRAPAAAREIERPLATLAHGFARVMPAEAPLPVRTVQEESGKIAVELSKATDVQLAISRGALEEIWLVRSAIRQVLDAYKGGRQERAEELVTEAYLDHFERAQGPLGRKSEPLMARLERLIRNDLRGKLKAGAAVTEVEQLVRAILASLEQAEQLLSDH